MPKNAQQVRVTVGIKPKSIYPPSTSLSNFTKSFENHDFLARGEKDFHIIITHLSESALSLEISWVHPQSCVPPGRSKTTQSYI